MLRCRREACDAGHVKSLHPGQFTRGELVRNESGNVCMSLVQGQNTMLEVQLVYCDFIIRG